MKSFLYYWRPETFDYELGRGLPLNHSGSEQFDRVTVGDDIWFVTIRGGALSVLGRIKVGYVGDQAGAANLLNDNDLWDATFHVVSATDTAQPLREIPLGEIAGRLRFKSLKDRLHIVDGFVDVNQLRTMRELTAASAFELETEFGRRVESQGKLV